MFELDFESVFRIGFLVGALAVALGLACFFVPSIIRYYVGGTFRRYLSASYSDRMQISLRFWNEEFWCLRTSRWGRAAQVLLAIGFTFLILTGIAWFALRIFETYGTRH